MFHPTTPVVVPVKVVIPVTLTDASVVIPLTLTLLALAEVAV